MNPLLPLSRRLCVTDAASQAAARLHAASHQALVTFFLRSATYGRAVRPLAATAPGSSWLCCGQALLLGGGAHHPLDGGGSLDLWWAGSVGPGSEGAVRPTLIDPGGGDGTRVVDVVVILLWPSTAVGRWSPSPA